MARSRRVALGVAAALMVVAAVIWRIEASRFTPRADEWNLEQLGDYGRVPAFSLTERSGRQITREDLLDHVSVIDFIYTECTDTCPAQSLQMAQIEREFADARDLRLVSITVDPRHDTREVLARYAERYQADDRWWFLAGDQHAIYCLAKDGFRLGVADSSTSQPAPCGERLGLGLTAAWASHGSTGLIMHSARFVLVDRVTRIRAYHVATDTASMQALRGNLRRLLSGR